MAVVDDDAAAAAQVFAAVAGPRSGQGWVGSGNVGSEDSPA